MESVTDCFGLPFRKTVMQPCWKITLLSKNSWLSQAIYSHLGFGWNLWLRYALVQLLSLRSKTASRLILAKQESLFLSSSVSSGTVIVSETQIDLCLPFVDSSERLKGVCCNLLCGHW